MLAPRSLDVSSVAAVAACAFLLDVLSTKRYINQNLWRVHHNKTRMALSNVEIASHLKRNSPYFYKVFAYDQFRPENCPFLPIAIVVNSEPLAVEMGHWVALYVDQKRRGTFFDSYGMQPWGKIASFLQKMPRPHNSIKLYFKKTKLVAATMLFFS